MMTDYNDGNWHPWNGGECPVHPKSLVVVMVRDGMVSPERQPARAYKWDEDHTGTIVAFRVVKEHKEPREYWVSRLTSIAYISYREALYEGCHPEFLDHVKEVL